MYTQKLEKIDKLPPFSEFIGELEWAWGSEAGEGGEKVAWLLRLGSDAGGVLVLKLRVRISR